MRDCNAASTISNSFASVSSSSQAGADPTTDQCPHSNYKKKKIIKKKKKKKTIYVYI
jgi:hypothetical protein